MEPIVAEKVLEKALREEGLRRFNIIHKQLNANSAGDAMPRQTIFLVEKGAPNGVDEFQFKMMLDTKNSVSSHKHDEHLKDKIRYQAELIAQKLRPDDLKTYDWGSRVAEVSLSDGGWAKCEGCGAIARFNDAVPNVSMESAESSLPNPSLLDREETLYSMEEDKKHLARLYLLGKLKRFCTCPYPSMMVNSSAD